jgi:hypothetical protein
LETARALAGLRSAPTVVLTSSAAPVIHLGGFAFIAKADICARQLRRAMRSEIHTDKESDMSLQAYYDSITAKTGKTPEQLIELARAEGLLEPRMRAGQIITWLRENYGLGHGHAMAVVATIKKQGAPEQSTDEKVARHFGGKKAGWRPVYDGLVQKVAAFGPDADVLAGATYLSLRRAGKKFAIVQVTAERLDVGIKLSDAHAHERLEAAGSWNSMVTHRVRVHRAAEVDQELLGWLRRELLTTTSHTDKGTHHADSDLTRRHEDRLRSRRHGRTRDLGQRCARRSRARS